MARAIMKGYQSYISGRIGNFVKGTGLPVSGTCLPLADYNTAENDEYYQTGSRYACH